MIEAGNAASMKAGRSWKSDLLSVKYLEAFRGKELHRVSVLLLRVVSYNLDLVQYLTDAEDEISVCLLRETFYMQIQVTT